MAKIQILPLLLSHLFVAIGSAVSCSCNGAPGHIQHEFCKSDFAAHVEILDKKTVHGQVEYTVHLFGEYRKQRIKNGTTIHVTTPGSSQNCGVPYLKRGRQYLIMGQIDQGIYWFDDCNYRSPWSLVDNPCQTDSLKFGEYLKNCRVCQVSFCLDQNNCYPLPSGRGCDDSGGENYRDVCEFDGFNACRWVKC